MFFRDHQTESGLCQLVAAGDDQQFGASGFYPGIGKNPGIIPGRKQAITFTKAEFCHGIVASLG